MAPRRRSSAWKSISDVGDIAATLRIEERELDAGGLN